MNRNTLFTLVFLVLLGLIGYMWYRYLDTGTDAAAEDRQQFARTLAEVRRLKNLQLDTSLFQDRFFRDLEEPQEVPQPEVTPGRTNPFAPFR